MTIASAPKHTVPKRIDVNLNINVMDAEAFQQLWDQAMTGLKLASQLLDPELIAETGVDNDAWRTVRDNFLRNSEAMLSTQAVLREAVKLPESSPRSIPSIVRGLVAIEIAKACPEYGINWPPEHRLQ